MIPPPHASERTWPCWGKVSPFEKLIRAFYAPGLSFRRFVERYPEHRVDLIDCLVGDVIGKNMAAFMHALDEMMASGDQMGVA